MKVKSGTNLLKETAKAWSDDDIVDYSAALAYFMIFSIAPLLIIAVAVAGFVFGEQTARQELLARIQGIMGAQGAEFLNRMLDNASQPKTGIIASVIGLVTLLLGATRIFDQLKKTLNRIWGVAPPPGSGIKGFLTGKLWAALMVLLVGALLIGLLVASAVLTALQKQIGSPIAGMAWAWQVADLLLSAVVLTVLFALIFKFLPDTRIAWRDVWVGAIVTGILFVIGKYLIGLYLARGSVASPYGAAGSLVILLLWFYYSALILFTGAEFTEVYSRLHGSRQEGVQARSSPKRKQQTTDPATTPTHAISRTDTAAPQRTRARNNVLILATVGLLSFFSRSRPERHA